MSGKFEIIYPGESFTITFDFSQRVYPTIDSVKVDGGNPHNYVVKILDGPTVNNLEASVRFQIYDP